MPSMISRRKRRRVDQLVKQSNRTQVGKQAQFFANFQQAGFGTSLGGRVVPLWTADRTQQDRITRFARIDRRLR